MRKLALIALIAALLQNAGAQRMGAAPHFAPQHSPSFARPFLYPVPFFSDSLYSNVIYPSGYAYPQPTIIVMQAPPPAEPERVQLPAQPLLIELQGGRYVRVSGEGSSDAEMIGGETINGQTADASKMPGSYAAPHRVAAEAPTPVALVFRDGHREEVSAYTIADGVLYATGNYYSDGAWSRKVELSSLNLPETVVANRSRGMQFQLPRAANEVIVGP
jgi:hypothetical protein